MKYKFLMYVLKLLFPINKMHTLLLVYMSLHLPKLIYVYE